jgi:hypothetical protein
LLGGLLSQVKRITISFQLFIKLAFIMAKTCSMDAKGYVVNHYLSRKLSDENFLVTTEHGGWAILNTDEFRLLRHGKVEYSSDLYNVLSHEGIIINENNLGLLSSQCSCLTQLLFI